MKYVLSVDWLSIFGHTTYDPDADEEDCSTLSKHKDDIKTRLPLIDGWEYETQPYGTRQFKVLVFVYLLKEKICEVQLNPCSGILEPTACIVKFDNRLLYSAKGHDLSARFLQEHRIEVQRISRIDICADFLSLNGYDCHEFIKDFLGLKIRHIGRGIGAAYFHHKSKKVEGTSYTIANLKYSGLSFGSHDSDVRVYLYNKTKELQEVHDKPHIRDTWVAAGLVDADAYQVTRKVQKKDSEHTFFKDSASQEVWRLEVSIHGDAIRFKNKETEQMEEITYSRIWDLTQRELIYHTFIHYYFQFIRNRDGITNVTREPRINLLGNEHPYMLRIVPRNVSGGNMAERIIIHKLWQLNEEYRKLDNEQFARFAKEMAMQVADATDLKQWFFYKASTWDKKHYKQ